MFTDSHCHLSTIAQRDTDIGRVLRELGDEGCPFLLDIGTKPGDLGRRIDLVKNACNGIIPPFLHFSCGLWPDALVIADRANALAALEADVKTMLSLDGYHALGECGLDRFWNGPAAEKVDSTGTTDIHGEEEMFSLQLELANRHGLSVIVHSRDAFEPTVSILKNQGSERGVIHCWSYGIPQARAFLDLGFHISFPGNITWIKREADRERASALLSYIPRERLLFETDAPYMAPAPHRGSVNTPLLIKHIYEFAAPILSMDVRSLADLVETNAKALFSIRR